jgi:L-fuculose-phosphate aldolase
MSSVASEKVAPPREKLVKWLARLYRHRLTTTTGGNLSILDDDGTLYITPSGGDKAIVPACNVAVRNKGEKIFSGDLPPSTEWPLHAAAYEARPDDCRAVLHAHSMTLVAFSLAHNTSHDSSSESSKEDEKKDSLSPSIEAAIVKGDRRVPDTRCLLSAFQSCGTVALAPYCIPGSMALAQGCAEALKNGANCVILRNHGVVTIGKTMHEAYDRFVSLEYLARSIAQADTLGKPLKTLPPSILLQLENERKGVQDAMCLPAKLEHCPSCTKAVVSNRTMKADEKEVLSDLCKFVRRAYEQNLITTSSGSFSHRLDVDRSPGLSFTITPTDVDRGVLLPSDLCFVSNQLVCGSEKRGVDGASTTILYHPMHPCGSLLSVSPSRAAGVHATIYNSHPEVKCIMITTPTYATVFCVTGSKFDSAGIPESHIVLHNVETLPFDSLLHDGGLKIAKALDPAKGKTTVMVEGYGLITVGPSLLKTFVQLEVCESMCGVNLTAFSRGPVDLLTPDQVREIDDVFKTH